MNCWCSIISAYLLHFYILVYAAVSQSNPINPTTDIPNCSGCRSYPSMLNNSSHHEVSKFSVLNIINNNDVVIGGKHSLVVFSSDGKFKYNVEIKSTTAAFESCKTRNSGKSELCPNIINLVIQDKDLVIACGTNSDRPQCWIVNGTKIVKTFRTSEYYPKRTVKYLKTDSYLFTAYQDKNGKGRLYKVDINSQKPVFRRRFAFETSPHFVSLYEFGDYIYYFFNEFPKEILDSVEKEAFSRVGRLCKYDTGGSGTYDKRMTLFAKVRLLCAKPASSSEKLPYHYNLLEQTSFVKTEDGHVYIYGIFKSGPGSPVSAICRFTLSDIDKLFDSTTTEFFDIHNVPPGLPSTRFKNDPRFLKCNSLDTTKIAKTTADLSMATPLAVSAVKADGLQVIELDATTKPHIISEYVPTNDKTGYHVIYVIDSNVMFSFAAPIGPGIAHLTSQTKISKNPLKISDMKIVKHNIFVAAEREIVIAPVSSCHLYNSCRDCVAARNPHCAWNNNLKNCTKYDPLQSSIYQDISSGDYSKVCEKEKASCEIRLMPQIPIPNREVVFSCKVFGVPTTNFISWKKDGKTLSVGSKNIIEMAMQGERRLVIKNYNISDAGKYSCNVSNGDTSGSCSVPLPGSEPNLKCSVSKQGFWLLSCSATGFPEPAVQCNVFANSGRMVHSNFTTNTKIVPEQSYQFLAYNSFGVALGNSYQLYSTPVVLKILNKSKSDCGKTELASKLKREVKKLYKDVEMFEEISNVTLRNIDSCMASFIFGGLTSSSFPATELIRPLMNAIKNGDLGDLKIKAYVEEPTSDPNTQCTSKPLSTPTRPSNSSSPNTKGVRDDNYKGESSCTKEHVVIVLLIILLVCSVLVNIIFVVIYCIKKQRKAKAKTTENNSENEEEMDEISRSKERESRRNLIDRNAGKHVSPSKKKTMDTDGKRSSEISRQASIEIMNNDDNNHEEDRPKSDQSVC